MGPYVHFLYFVKRGCEINQPGSELEAGIIKAAI